MRDVLPAEKRTREHVLATIRGVYRRFGYTEIETPAVEPLSRLRSKQGGENESMLFEILRRGLAPDEPVLPADAVDLALRYDLTVPLTRYYASHVAELPEVFRALQTGPVWRAERPQKGRYRQFTQVDIDILGEPGIVAEVDLLVATLAAFDALGMAGDVTLLVNDRRSLEALLAAAGFAPDEFGDALVALDKLDKIGADGVAAELAGRGLGDDDAVRRVLDTVLAVQGRPEGSDEALAAGALALAGGGSVPLHDLPAIVAAVRRVVPGARVRLDPTLVRGMGYYTGPIFEMKHTGAGYSVAGGGRYDGVVGKWLGRDVPACGFSIGFERVIDLVAAGDDDGRRVALLYAEPVDVAELLEHRAALQADGADVTLVRTPRKPSARFWDSLVAQGLTHAVDHTDETGRLRTLGGAGA
jgi:histidyl-tRNA synthetase